MSDRCGANGQPHWWDGSVPQLGFGLAQDSMPCLLAVLLAEAATPYATAPGFGVPASAGGAISLSRALDLSNVITLPYGSPPKDGIANLTEVWFGRVKREAFWTAGVLYGFCPDCGEAHAQVSPGAPFTWAVKAPEGWRTPQPGGGSGVRIAREAFALSESASSWSRPVHSFRSAAMGSTLAARRAGIQAARRATAINSPPAPMSVRGSLGCTP